MRAGQPTGFGVTYAKYVGRVGALAVALGIGATVAGIGGTAWADDTTDSTSPDTSEGSNEAEDTAGNDTGTETADVDDAVVDAPEPEPEDTSTPDAETDDADVPAPEHRRPLRTLSQLIEHLRDTIVPDALPTNDDEPADDADTAEHAPAQHVQTTVDAPQAEQASAPPADTTVVADTPDDTTDTVESATLRVASPSQSLTTADTTAAPVVARPGPIRQIVTTILSAFGLNSQAAPGTPRPFSAQFFIAALELVRREIERTFFNTTPEVDATPNHLTVDQGASQTFTMPGSDEDGDRLTYTVTQPPAQGTVSAPVYDATTDTYTFTYTADPDAPTAAAIDDSFTVAATDAGARFHLHGLLGLFQNRHTDTATVTVDIENGNDAPQLELVGEPTVDPDTGAVTYQVCVTDPDGDPYTVYVPAAGDAGYPEHGELEVSTAGNVTTIVYTPDRDYYFNQINGDTESFVIAAEDANGLTNVEVLTYSWSPDQKVVGEVRIEGVSSTVPVAFSDDRSVAYLVTTLGNDFDPESNSVVVTVIDMTDYSVIGTYDVAPGYARGVGQPAVKGTTLYQVVEGVDGTNRLYAIGRNGQQVVDPIELDGRADFTPQVSPDGAHLFVVSHDLDDRNTTYVSVIDTSTNDVVQVHTLTDAFTEQWGSPYALTFTPDGQFAYLVTDTATQRHLTVIDATDGTIAGDNLVLGASTGYNTDWYFTDTKAVAFARMSSTNDFTQATVVDLATNTVVGQPINLGGNADRLILSPDGSRGFVVATDIIHNTTLIHQFNVNTGQGISVKGINNTGGIAQGTLTEDGQTLIVTVNDQANPAVSRLILIDVTGSSMPTMSTGAATTPGAAAAPWVYAEDGAAAYGRNAVYTFPNYTTHLTKYDTATNEVLWSTETPGYPRHVYLADDGSTGYLVTTGRDAEGNEYTRINAFDPQTGEITGISGAFGGDDRIYFSDDGSTMYITTREYNGDGYDAVFRAIDLAGETVTNDL